MRPLNSMKPIVLALALAAVGPSSAKAAPCSPSPDREATAEASPRPGNHPSLQAESGKDASPLALQVAFRPSAVAPGGMFQFTLTGEQAALASEVELVVGEKDAFKAFKGSDGRWTGFGAVAVTKEGRKSVPARLLWKDAQGRKGASKMDIPLSPRTFPSSRLRVSRRFTSPTAAQKARAKEDAQAFAQAYAVQGGGPGFASNFAYPLEGESRVTSAFGGKRMFNGKVKSRHLGLDLDGETGDKVHAAGDGVVTMRRDCFYAGNAVVISHGAGLFTSYFHLTDYGVSVGDRVKKGDLVGTVGSSGRVTGPHLHFGAKLGTVNFDPMALLEFDFFPGRGPAEGTEGVGPDSPSPRPSPEDGGTAGATPDAAAPGAPSSR